MDDTITCSVSPVTLTTAVQYLAQVDVSLTPTAREWIYPPLVQVGPEWVMAAQLSISRHRMTPAQWLELAEKLIDADLKRGLP